MPPPLLPCQIGLNLLVVNFNSINASLFLLSVGNAGGWCADSDLLNVTQYLQIDFGSKQSICRIATQGQHEQPNWVTHYKLGYSDDGQHWTIYQEKAKDKVQRICSSGACSHESMLVRGN